MPHAPALLTVTPSLYLYSNPFDSSLPFSHLSLGLPLEVGHGAHFHSSSSSGNGGSASDAVALKASVRRRRRLLRRVTSNSSSSTRVPRASALLSAIRDLDDSRKLSPRAWYGCCRHMISRSHLRTGLEAAGKGTITLPGAVPWSNFPMPPHNVFKNSIIGTMRTLQGRE